MKKLSIIIPVHNQFIMLKDCLEGIEKNSITNPQVIIIDNGSIPALNVTSDSHIEYLIVKNEKNIGVWPTFKQGFEKATGDVLCYIHSDLIIHEHGWDKRLLDAFEADPLLGLVGFVGSNEWSWDGGRGGGTMSNFQGIGRGSPAEAHGKRIFDLTPALQVDGCSMVMSREAMEKVGFFEWPPHHFYDRIYSLRILKAGLRVGVMGIACDHISGQTANTEEGWQKTAEEWCKSKGIMEMTAHNWDYTVYNEAEKMFLPELHEYLGQRRSIACDSNNNIY